MKTAGFPESSKKLALTRFLLLSWLFMLRTFMTLCLCYQRRPHLLLPVNRCEQPSVAHSFPVTIYFCLVTLLNR